jgi:hypothetical protein
MQAVQVAFPMEETQPDLIVINILLLSKFPYGSGQRLIECRSIDGGIPFADILGWMGQEQDRALELAKDTKDTQSGFGPHGVPATGNRKAIDY